MIRLADPTLVVLVGVSGSGKSTWANEHFAAEQIVSSDRLRGIVGEDEADQSASSDAFAVLDLIVDARTKRRLTTVVDSTGLDTEHRRRLRAVAARHGVDCVAVVVATPAAVARRRNSARSRRVPTDVLTRQLATFKATVPLLAGEGFTDVIEAEPVRLVAASVAAAERALADVRMPAPASSTQGGVTFGLHLSVFPRPGAAPLGEQLTSVAARAEAAGFDSLWVMDHMRQIPQLGRAWDDMPEAVATLGFLAAATSRVTVGCLVHCVTYRNIGLLAKSLATVDVLSGGRVWCGLGAGWFEAEHAAYGWPFPPAAQRLDLLEDALEVLPMLWGAGAPAYTGRRTTVPETMSYPRPVRGRIPILVGGSGERRTLRLVAQHADACNLFGTADQVAAKLDVLHRHCADVGRDPATVEITHLSTVLVGRDESDLAALVARRRPPRGQARWTAATNPGTVADHVLRIRALQRAGVGHVIVAVDDVWRDGSIEAFAEVMGVVRA